MLPLVFDDTSAKNKGAKKAEDEPIPTPDNIDEGGFTVNSNDKEDMPLKDVVVITIFQHWFDIEISSDNKS